MCNIGELSGVLQWPSKIDGHLGAILDELGGTIIWPTQKGGIFSAILVNWVWYLNGPQKIVQFWVEYLCIW